jgi:hypothetical protein
MPEEIRSKLNAADSCCRSIQILVSFHVLLKMETLKLLKNYKLACNFVCI